MGWSERISASGRMTIVVICGLLLLPGCPAKGKSGSGSAVGSGSASAKRLPPLQVDRAMSVPGDWRRENLFVKPGHWSAAWVDAAANQEDFQGDLEIRVENRPNAPGVPYSGPAVRRPLVLPKGERRAVEGAFFLPWPTFEIEFDASQPFGSRNFGRPNFGPLPYSQNVTCTVSLVPRGRRRSDLTTTFQTTELKNHQAVFCILADQPERYHFFAGLDVITAPQGSHPSPDEVHYRLSIAEDNSLRAPLPSQANGWTTVAYLLWDGYDPTRLTEPQQTALLDWLHWGGQMLVSGPASLTTLQRSFLEPYLPARDGGTVTLDAAALEPLGSWKAPNDDPLKPSHPWAAVKLEPDERGDELLTAASAGAGPLVVERRIGRGRIVVTAFSLSEFDLADWPSFDTFLNGALMRRPARRIVREGEFESLEWRNPRTPWLDPTRISNVRYVARDEGRTIRAPERPLIAGSYETDGGGGPGVAAWRDDGPVVDRARELLRAEARIVIPDVKFVIYVVLAYFVVLVPLNWLVFRILGRPEWAWFAAPVIAAGCSIAVVRLAELDVGFARSSSEAVIVELQPDYPRAHVSRFVAVYNSLGTDYELRGDDPSTIALPLEPGESEKKKSDVRRNTPAETVEPANRRKSETMDPSNWRIGRVTEGERDYTSINGFLVESNLVELLRAEHMRDVGGGVRCERLDDGRFRITNGTRLGLTDCRITGAKSGRIERLAAGATVELELEGRGFGRRDDPKLSLVDRMRVVLEGPTSDDLRLTALAEDEVGGFTISPQPSQVKRTTFVVAHLEYHLPKPEKDQGVRRVRRPVQ